MCIDQVLPIPLGMESGEGIKVFWLSESGELLTTMRNHKYTFGVQTKAEATHELDVFGKKYLPLIHIYVDLQSAKSNDFSFGERNHKVFVRGTYTGARVWDEKVIVAETFTPIEIVLRVEGEKFKDVADVQIRRVTHWEAFLLNVMFAFGLHDYKLNDHFLHLQGLKDKNEYSKESFRAHREYLWNDKGLYV